MISHYGGINFVIGALNKKKIPQLIDSDKHCGKRVKQATYSYSDIIMGWIYCTFCGAKRIEDCNDLREELNTIPKSQFPSPDRIADILKSFANDEIKINPFEEKTDGEKDENDEKAENQTNENELFQDILMSVSTRLEALKPGIDYTLDYDTITIPTEKYDSRYTYKNFRGYNPAVAFINNVPIYIHARNGNSSPKYGVRPTLEKIFDSLEKHKRKVKRIRMDEASYQEDVINYLDKKTIDFFIRARGTKKTLHDSEPHKKWTSMEIKNSKEEVKSLDFWFDEKMEGKKYRLVLQRKKNSTGKLHKVTWKPYVYRAIITNNWEMSDEEVVRFYNYRGSAERHFDDLLNNFNWKRLPFSFMQQNLVFMYVAAISKVIYQYLIVKFSAKFTKLKNNLRLKKFTNRFIKVSSEWICENGRWILQLEKKTDYDKLYGMLRI